MRPIKITSMLLILALGISVAQDTSLAGQSNSESPIAESKLRENGWLPVTTNGFHWWVALEEVHNQEGSIFVFLEHKYFTRESLHQIFNNLANRLRPPIRLEVTILGDEEAMKQELSWRSRHKALGIIDFMDNERGREGKRKYLEKEASERKRCFRAFYTRSRDGKEWFKYTPSPDTESYIWINLEGGLLKEDTRKALIQAVEQGDFNTIERLVSQGVSLNIQSPTGNTLLMFQPSENKRATVKLLLRLGERVDARDTYRRTPLIHAAAQGDEELVKVLLEHGADVNAQDGPGNTALLLAARKQYPAIVEILAKSGSDLNRGDRYGVTPLMWAAVNGDVRSIKTLLSNGADLNARDDRGSTALFYASFEPGSVVDALVDAGAQIDARDKDGCTPLMRAAVNPDPTKAEALIRRGAKVNLKNKNGETALDLAREEFGPNHSVTKVIESAKPEK
jgi:ankyrin repeat protein